MLDKSEAVKGEYLTIEKTEFWRLFMGEIASNRDSAMKSLVFANVESVAALQGLVRAYDKVLALPKKIVDGLTADEAAPEA